MTRSIPVILAAVMVLGISLTPTARAQAGHRATAASCPTVAGVSGSGNGASALASADNTFGFRLFDQIFGANSSKNVFVSPTSAATVLDMLYAGARGTSQIQVASGLGVTGLSRQQVRSRAAALLSALHSGDSKVQLEIANSLWARTGERFQSAFLSAARKFYGAKVTAIDFRAPDAPSTINSWVACATHNTITSIVDKIPASMVMYALNATYFHGQWTTAFDPRKTSTGMFTTASGQQEPEPFMHMTGQAFPYYANADLQMIGLPYGSGRFSMVIALPRATNGLPALVHGLTLSKWQAWVAQMHASDIPLALPRFRADNSWNLNKPLASLGLKTAIGPHGNFSGICFRCALTEVRQKSYISVDEKGTTAAAVTSGGVSATVARQSLLIDHPFLYAITDRTTGAILFMGAENNPGSYAPASSS